jgi:hypothetical protein
MRRKIVSVFFCFVTLTQVIPVGLLVSIAVDYFNTKNYTISLAISMPDEEMEEEGVKEDVAYISQINYSFSGLVEEQINKDIQYLHHFANLPEGFARVLYTPPNLA